MITFYGLRRDTDLWEKLTSDKSISTLLFEMALNQPTFSESLSPFGLWGKEHLTFVLPNDLKVFPHIPGCPQQDLVGVESGLYSEVRRAHSMQTPLSEEPSPEEPPHKVDMIAALERIETDIYELRKRLVKRGEAAQ